MRRQKRTQQYLEDDDDYYSSNARYELLEQTNGADNEMEMNSRGSRDVGSTKMHRFESTIVTKVEDGDTLQALALKFHCTVADLKRLNKIDKDNEIHAHKVLKIPVTVHSVLLNTLPKVHRSENSSPKDSPRAEESESIMRNPLADASVMLSEKLLVASVNAASSNVTNTFSTSNLSSNVSTNATIYTDEDSSLANNLNDITSPLLRDILDDDFIPQPRPLKGPAISAFDWSGSDCDMSWVCLLVVILGLCFVIPLVYVIYLAEHTHHNGTNSH